MTLAAPFPYFGGKRRAAPIVWRALGDPSGYVEPFAGSAAVLLSRPPFTGRRVETINDADGWLINCWRSLQLDPTGVATHALGPVTEIDYHARLAWLQERRTPELVAWLEGDPEAHDPKAAGWWLYVLACGIGDPWGGGPWRVVDGRLVDTRATRVREATDSPTRVAEPAGIRRELPHLGDAGQGINRELPHLGNAGQGIHRALPHLGNAGRGIHRALPHLGNAGRGELIDYLSRIADRMARVRITCGDWKRVVQPSVIRSGSGGDGARAIFLDPPYATSGDLYGHVDTDVSHEVREWCKTAPSDLRIILCGYDNEHDDLGWEKVEGKSGGGAGYSVRRDNGRRERLWLSPACLGLHQQADLFGGDAA